MGLERSRKDGSGRLDVSSSKLTGRPNEPLRKAIYCRLMGNEEVQVIRQSVVAAVVMAGVAVPAVAQDAEVTEEVVVISEPFARWDDTRWLIHSQVLLPYPVTFPKENNAELQVVAYDLEMVMNCNLAEKRGPKKHEVMCMVEGANIGVAPWRRIGKKVGQVPEERASSVVEELSSRFKDLEVLLQVTDDGRVVNVGFVNVDITQRRTNVLYENIRQMIRLEMGGFYLQNRSRQLANGMTWEERGSLLFTLPSFQYVKRTGVASELPEAEGAMMSSSGTEPGTADFDQVSDNLYREPFGSERFEDFIAPASVGFSDLTHVVQSYKGHFVIQSSGSGMLDLGSKVPLTFSGQANAVSVFEPNTGIMAERVWTVSMLPTAGSAAANGVAGWPYIHTGNMTMIDKDTSVVLGQSRLYAPPKTPRGQLPFWPSL